MAIRYSWLKQGKNETKNEFKTRISNEQFVHVGYAYFGAHSYDYANNRYLLIITWNGEFNSYLKNPMPECGFVIDCDENVATYLYCTSCMIPVEACLDMDEYGLFCSSLRVAMDNQYFKVDYLGMNATSPDYISFAPSQGFESTSYKAVLNNTVSGSYNAGSFNLGSFYLSGFNYRSFNVGSFNTGSFNTGSFHLESFSIGSFNLGSFSLGSFSIGSFNLGSFSLGSFSLGSFSFERFNLGSFNIGSFNVGSYNVTGFNSGSYNISSFNVGSFARTSFNTGIYTVTLASNESSNENINGPVSWSDVFGIGFLGYGLNLI